MTAESRDLVSELVDAVATALYRSKALRKDIRSTIADAVANGPHIDSTLSLASGFLRLSMANGSTVSISILDHLDDGVRSVANVTDVAGIDDTIAGAEQFMERLYTLREALLAQKARLAA